MGIYFGQYAVQYAERNAARVGGSIQMIAMTWLLSLSLGLTPAQTPAFEVASVKASQRAVGPDYNNQLTFSPSGVTGKNVTLKRLIAEAYRLQLNQVIGPSWLDQNEYDIETKTDGQATREQVALMLRTLLAERFDLKQHRETR